MDIRSTSASVIVCLITTSTVEAGPDWLEDIDAGSTIGTAQDTTAEGVLTTITGALSPGDTEDLFLIRIDSASDFMTATFGVPFDTSLWLFDMDGFGLLGNLDSPMGGDGSLLRTPSDDGVTLELPGPGVYVLAITEAGNVPLSDNGSLPMFEFLVDTEISGPDGPGGFGQLGPWSDASGLGGDYTIQILPAPGALAPLVVALAFGRRRRRGCPVPVL